MSKKYHTFLAGILLPFLPLLLFGQNHLETAKTVLLENQIELGLLPLDLQELRVTNTHKSKKSELTHIYLQQQFQGIDIEGAVGSVHLNEEGATVKVNNSFIPQLAAKVLETEALLSAVEAIEKAAIHLGFVLKTPLIEISKKDNPSKEATFHNHDFSNQDIPVKLLYFPKENKTLSLAWEVEIYEVSGLHYWVVLVDAQTGEVIREKDMVLRCGFDNHGNPAPSAPKGELSLARPTSHNSQPAGRCSPLGWDGFCWEQKGGARGAGTSLLAGSYKVFDLPLANPTQGSRTLIADPDDPTASPFGWHDTDGVAGAEFTTTQGNNVHAYDDGNNPGYNPEGGVNLLFDFPLDLNGDPETYEDAAISNAFFITNRCHDILYHYGFDEAAGNFQENNYGNGGLGSDYLEVEVQDLGGTCNANMFTPADGQKPKMQIYLCNGKDGAYSNTLLVHEYVHGLTNRLTGGASNVSCLNNLEQMGEGWSDWYSLMFSMKSGDTGSDPIYYGDWFLDEAEGIRTHPYTTDLSLNPHTYDDIKLGSVPHGIGSIWCAMLWDMTWLFVDTYGFDPDLLNGTGGNNKVLEIVTEALKLQPCSPGFVDARDAVLLADQNINGGANSCLIWEAFARRGLGFSADQGNSDNRFDGVEAFDLPNSCALVFSKDDSPGIVQPGHNTTYTLTVTNNTNATVQNIDITDDIPTNTTYVANSASNGGNLQNGKVVFPTIGSLSSGASETRTFQVQTNNNLPSHNILFEDDFENGGTNWNEDFPWVIGQNFQFSGNAFLIDGNLATTCSELEMKNQITLDANSQLKFRHYYVFTHSNNKSGGFVEISTDNGGSWQTLDNLFTKKGYDETFNSLGNSCNHSDGIFANIGGTYFESVVDLSSFGGQSVLIRFNLVVHSSSSQLCRWYIDDVKIGTFSEIENIANLKADGFCKYATLDPPTIVTNNTPPSNDECSGAVTASVNSDMTCGTITSGTTNFATQSETDCNSVATKDTWFSFQATDTKHRFEISNNAHALGIQIYSGTCGNLTSLHCQNTEDGFNLDNLTIGSTYFIRIFTQNGTTTTNFDLCIKTFPPPPANDECSGAVTLILNTNGICTNQTSSTTLSATQSLAACSGGTAEDVWFTFTALGTGNLFEFSNMAAVYGNPNNLDLGFEVFSGDCNNLTSINCISSLANNQTITGFTPGEVYFMRVYTGQNVTEEHLNFDICVKSSLPNDDCEYAVQVIVNLDDNCANTTPATTINSTQSETACNGAASSDSWYQFQATSKIHQISILNTVQTVGMELYEGNCNGLNSLICTELANLTYFNFTVGNTYFLRTYTPSGSTTTDFDLCVKSPAPGNDECANVVSATVNNDLNCGTTHSGTTWNATASTPIPNCSSGTIRDVWYSFTATANEHRIVLSNTSASTNIEILSGSCGNFTSLFCQSTTSLDATGLNIGTTYLVRIYTLTSNTPTDFTLCIGTLPPPANDDCAGAISVTVNGNGNCISKTTGSTSNATSSGIGCATNNVADVWFSFVATDQRHEIEILNIVGTVSMEILDGSCNNLSVKDCPLTNTAFYNDFTIGNTYFIKVYSSGFNNISTFDVCVKTPPAPANDDCQNAIVATVNADPNCNVVNSGTTQYAGQSASSCFGSQVLDVWYFFTALDTDVQITLSNTSTAEGLEVYEGTCNNLTSLACEESNNLMVTGLTVGTDYFVRVFSFSIFTTFDLCIRETTPPPVNDDCVSAIAAVVNQNVSCGQITAGSTIAASESNPSCFGEMTKDTWFEITATHTAHYIDVLNIVAENGNNVGLGFEFYEGACGNLTSLFCINDILFENQNLTGLTIGSDYLIRIFTTDIGDAADFDVCPRLPGALPVELVHFRAVEQNGQVFLEWETARELNSSHFEIEHSLDGLEFEKVGEVQAAGFSSNRRFYDFLHKNPSSRLNYYRLKINDLDGFLEYSGIVSVDLFNLPGLANLSVYPNPATEVLTLQSSEIPEEGIIELYDGLGRRVRFVPITDSKIQSLFIDQLSPGAYFLKVVFGGKRFEEKVMIY